MGISREGVGVAEGLGVVPALAGLLLLVYGIHKFGRLGLVEDDAVSGGRAPGGRAERTAWAGVWMGGLTAAAGLAVTFASAGRPGLGRRDRLRGRPRRGVPAPPGGSPV